MKLLLPNRVTPESRVNLVYTSSAVEKGDRRGFRSTLKKFQERYPRATFFDLPHHDPHPWYLAGSESERLAVLRQAMKRVDWLAPIYGGTGCEDLIRHFNRADEQRLLRQRPVVNGFSDTTFLLNYLYFKLGLLSFHYANDCGVFNHRNSSLFFDIISGRQKSLSFHEPKHRFIGAHHPVRKISGIAIGGNISTFRDMLDVIPLKVRSWKSYILFMEEYALDDEDVHRILIDLDQRGIFAQVKAVVIGDLDTFHGRSTLARYKKPNQVFGERLELFEYVLADTLSRRVKRNDPLPILTIEDFGHCITRSPIIIPIGAVTVLHPHGAIDFIGPFVK